MSNQYQDIRAFDETAFAFDLTRVLRTINPSNAAESIDGQSTLMIDPALELVSGSVNIAGAFYHFKLKVSSTGRSRNKSYPVKLKLVTSSGLKKELDPMWFKIVD